MTESESLRGDPGEHRPEPPMRPFLILWSGQAASLIGSAAVQFALIWWLTETTGSATILVTGTFLALLPPIVAGPFIGTLVDRWNRKRVMMAADGLVALASLVLALLYAASAVGPGVVLALLFARAVGSAFHGPAMTASTTLLVPSRHLTRIQGLNQALQGGNLVISAPLGAILYGLLPMVGVMLVDVVTALFAILPLLAIHVPQPERSPDADLKGAFRREFLDGLAYLRRRRGHMALVAMSAGVNACLIPAFALLPLFVADHLGGGALQLGWIDAMFGVGTLAGGVVLGLWGGTERRILTAMGGMIALGGTVILFGLSPAGAFPFALLAMGAIGASVPFVNGPVQAILQATVPPDLQGRVFSLMGSLAGLTAPFGLLLAAPAAELIGIRVWYLAGGVICVLMAIVGLASAAVMRIEEDHTTNEACDETLVAERRGAAATDLDDGTSTSGPGT